MWIYAGRCRIFIYLQAGLPAWVRLVISDAGRAASHPAFEFVRCSETAELEGREPIINTPAKSLTASKESL